MRNNHLQMDQFALLVHLSNYSLADRETCLLFFQGREKPDYGLRPLMRYNYITRRKDGLYGISSKGLRQCEKSHCWISCSGNQQDRQRLAQVSRTAALFMLMEVPSADDLSNMRDEGCFVPSKKWRKIRTAISSTSRFHGIFAVKGHRFAVHHVGDGNVEWQLFAERSLFYQQYGEWDNRATAMLMICSNGYGVDIADRVIRETMLYRKRLLGNRSGYFYETNKPIKYAKSPIKLHDQYNTVLFCEESELPRIIDAHSRVERLLANPWEGYVVPSDKDFWDLENYPERWVVNPANDLMKYLYLFSQLRQEQAHPAGTTIDWNIMLPKRYRPLARKYEEKLEIVEHDEP